MKKRFLMIGISPGYGGTEAVMYSMLPFFYERGIVFDYINTFDKNLCREDFLKQFGARIHYLNLRRRGRFFQYKKGIRDFFAKHSREYDGVLLNIQEPAYSTFVRKAKKEGIKRIILVSHFSGNAQKGSFFHRIGIGVDRLFLNRYATSRIAVSKLAGQYAFSPKPFAIIRSGIDVERFRFSLSRRQQVRKEMQIDSFAPLYVSVGRFTELKNQKFLLHIYKEISMLQPDARFMLIGNGEMETELRATAESLELDALSFITECNDPAPFLDAADAFIFPSLHEGLGMALVEAQCSGLPCFASDRVIPKEAQLNENLFWVGLDKIPREWAIRILDCSPRSFEQRAECYKVLISAGLTNVTAAEKYVNILCDGT